MADYKYSGMTAYILDKEQETEEKINVLGSAIEPLSLYTDVHAGIAPAYDEVLQTKEYEHIFDNDSLCYVQDYCLPHNTPSKYQKVHLERCEIKGVPMVKLYVPTVSKNQDRLDSFFMGALIPLINQLFGKDAISIKLRSAAEYQDFADATETVIKSVNERKPVLA